MRIQEIRKTKGISQKELATNLKIKPNRLSQYETGVTEPDIKMLKEIAKALEVSVDCLIDNEPPIATQSEYIKIPVLGKVIAGIPMDAVEDILDWEEIPAKWGRDGSEFFALQIYGDSMEPKMTEGDVVIVRKQPDVESGDIAVVLVDGERATVKIVKKQKTGIFLMPVNTSYEPIFYNNKEIEMLPVVVLGKVVELRRKF